MDSTIYFEVLVPIEYAARTYPGKIPNTGRYLTLQALT
jgi:hypothetical protein